MFVKSTWTEHKAIIGLPLDGRSVPGAHGRGPGPCTREGPARCPGPAPPARSPRGLLAAATPGPSSWSPSPAQTCIHVVFLWSVRHAFFSGFRRPPCRRAARARPTRRGASRRWCPPGPCRPHRRTRVPRATLGPVVLRASRRPARHEDPPRSPPRSSRCSQEDPLLTGGSTAVRDRGNSVRSRRGTPLPHRPRRPATGAPRSGTPARPWPSAPTPASGAMVSTTARRRAATPRKSRVAAPVGLVAEPWFADAAWPTASASAERRRGRRGRRPRTRKAPTGVSAGGGLLRCSPDWTRTSNPSINSRMLCQLSYGGPCTHACNEQSLYRPGTGNAKSPLSPGGGCGAASPARAARAGAPGSAPAAPRGRCAAARPAGRTCAG